MAENPALPPPPTDPSYYAYSIQSQLRAIDISLLTIALIIVLARVYIRTVTLRVFRLDDAFMVAAMLCSVVSCSIFLHVIELGMGKHIFAIPPENIPRLIKWNFMVGLVAPMSVCFTKISISVFLLPLTMRTRFRQFLWAVVVFLVIFTLFTFFTILFGCVPVSANWDFTQRPPPLGIGHAKCLPIPTYRGIALFNSITNIITDVVLAIIPVPLIWTLQVNNRTKATLILILSLGFFACAAGIVKTPLLFHFFDDLDMTGERSWYYAWQIIEMNVGIIAASLPSLKPAFRWLLETAKSLTHGVSGAHTGGSTYKRQSSSGYLRQKEGSNSASNSVGVHYSEQVIGAKSPNAAEMELKDYGPYNVRVTSNESGLVRGMTREDRSTDTILRDDTDSMEGRGIVRTTKVSIVTS
ncbi:hypothetical protein EJ04DRAFT_573411 [Polyplosphaeria fusca]|uniref:Rhodopsin domain-containing protein n=1 Tax=Polyplosphaeria fusca TaxID=682080 RepID=A0A9P4R8D3_9PLEO|nr:hypothetical protein EJ04DRAFT_573411 [Polyplosphaeria fusca]